MLTTAVKKITLNNLGNLDIKDESDLYDNTGNKIGIVKIELPNCKVEDDEIVVMSSKGILERMNREQRRKQKYGK